MPFVLLLLLALVSLQMRWPEPPFDFAAWESAVLTLGGLGLLWFVGSLGTAYFRARLAATSDRSLIHRCHARQRLFGLVLAGFYVLALYGFGWGWTVKEFWSEHLDFLPGLELGLLLPFLAALVACWARFYDFEIATQRTAGQGHLKPSLSRGAYVTLQVRFNLLLIVPPLFLTLLLNTIFRIFPELQSSEAFLPIFTLVFLAFAFLSIPWVLRVFLGLRPLPLGPLRDRLQAVGQRMGFRCNDILLWNTRNSMANAMVTGVLPGARYIVLTDSLIRDLGVDEVEAVLGHEIGHVKHHHMFFYTIFLLASLFTLASVWQVCETWLERVHVDQFVKEHVPLLADWQPAWELVAVFPPLVMAGAYVYVVFGCLSRYCERQADIFGCRTASCQVFINALEKVAALNGIHREKPGWFSSWRHPPIARRVDFLQRMQEDPEFEPRFQRRLGLVKWSMSLGLGLVLGATLWLGEVLRSHSSQDSAGAVPANPRR